MTRSMAGRMAPGLTRVARWTIPLGAALLFASGACGSEEEVAPVTTATPMATPAQTPVSTSTPTRTPAPTPVPTLSPTPTPVPIPADWVTYTDPELGFSFPHPPGLTISLDQYELPEKKGIPPVSGRLLWFRNPDGVPAIVIAVAANPANLTIEEWVNTYIGWSGAPEDLVIGGERALLDPKDQVNNPVPQIYFRRGAFFLTLQLNIHGIPEARYPAALSESDFSAIVQGFRFAE